MTVKLRGVAAGLALAGSLMALTSGARADGYDRGLKDAPVVAPFSWQGFYLGVNGGGAFATSKRSATLDPAYPLTAAQAAALTSQASGTLSADGFFGGAQVGYNFTSGPAVFGVEADYNALNLSKSTFAPMNPAVFVPGNNLIQSFKIDRLATLRARLGYAVGTTLFYGTGGLAVGNVAASDTFQFLAGTAFGSASANKTGYVLGLGIEQALGAHWTVKGEYLHADLGKLSYTSGPFAGFPNTDAAHTSGLTLDLLRVGINYKF